MDILTRGYQVKGTSTFLITYVNIPGGGREGGRGDKTYHVMEINSRVIIDKVLHNCNRIILILHRTLNLIKQPNVSSHQQEGRDPILVMAVHVKIVLPRLNTREHHILDHMISLPRLHSPPETS